MQTDETPQPPLTVAFDLPSTKIVDPTGPYLPSRAAASSVAGSGSIAADAPGVARWGYLLYAGRVIDASLVKQMEADPQHEQSKDMNYALGTMVADDNGQLIVGHLGGGAQWAYTSLMLVWTNPGMAVALLVPKGEADYHADLAFELHQLAAAASAS